MKNNNIGVMQGRLLPKYLGRYQAHPVNYWKDEFPLASKIGLDCIEFILDFNDSEQNPLLKSSGVDEILEVVEQTGITVQTVCADYFMEAPLHSKNEVIAQESLAVLHRLFTSSEEIGITDIVIPCVDQSSLRDISSVERFVKIIKTVVDKLEDKNLNLSLETDLAPESFLDLLDMFDSDRIKVNYDIGNSAALGFNPMEELEAYGSRITDIHIKDRLLGGGSVTLGEGNADFNLFFNKLKKFDYQGPFIMQAYRDDEGVDVFERQFLWIKPYLDKLYI